MMMQNKVIVAVVSSLILMLVLVFVVQFASRIGKTPVEIVVAPSSLELTLNEKTISAGVNYISPGNYTVNAYHPEFELLSLEITVSDSESQPLIIMLTPATEKGWEIARTDSAFKQLELEAGRIAAEDGLKLRDENPILNHIPYRSGFFNIDYRRSDIDKDVVVLVITVHPEEKKLPLGQIEDWGFNPEDFEIEFQNWW